MPSHDCDCCHFFMSLRLRISFVLGSKNIVYNSLRDDCKRLLLLVWCSSCYRFYSGNHPRRNIRKHIFFSLSFRSSLLLLLCVCVCWHSCKLTQWVSTLPINFHGQNSTNIHTSHTYLNWVAIWKMRQKQWHTWEKESMREIMRQKRKKRIEKNFFRNWQISAGDEWQLHCWIIISLIIMESCRHWTLSIHSTESKDRKRQRTKIER